MGDVDPTASNERFTTWEKNFETWSGGMTDRISAITMTTAEPTIKALEDTVIKTIACLEEKTTYFNGLSTTIARDYDTYSMLNKQLDTANESVKLSKERVGLLTTPEQKTTVYESWFPLRRPLQTSTFLLLLVVGLFFITMFFGLLLRQAGLFVDIGIISSVTPGQISWVFGQFNLLTIGLGIAFIGCILYLVRKK